MEEAIMQQEKTNQEKNFTASLLQGDGKNDYEKYMRINSLLSLQREKSEWIYRDELLFQITHQSTELWLKLQNEELEEAVRELNAGRLAEATALIPKLKAAIKYERIRFECTTAPRWIIVLSRLLIWIGVTSFAFVPLGICS